MTDGDRLGLVVGSGVGARDVGAGVGARVVGSGVGARVMGSGVGARDVGAGVGARVVGAGDGARVVGAGDGSGVRGVGQRTFPQKSFLFLPFPPHSVLTHEQQFGVWALFVHDPTIPHSPPSAMQDGESVSHAA